MFEFEGVRVTRNLSKNFTIVRLNRPIEVNTMGNYYVGAQEEGEERFSDGVKDWMVAENR